MAKISWNCAGRFCSADAATQFSSRAKNRSVAQVGGFVVNRGVAECVPEVVREGNQSCLQFQALEPCRARLRPSWPKYRGTARADFAQPTPLPNFHHERRIDQSPKLAVLSLIGELPNAFQKLFGKATKVACSFRRLNRVVQGFAHHGQNIVELRGQILLSRRRYPIFITSEE